MRVISVVGARPQFVKLAPLSQALAAASTEHKVIHTGQHYDSMMSDVFFEELKIPAPDWNLDVGSGSHATQTSEMLRRIEPILLDERPDWVLVYGDTNSTVAAALAAVKIGVRVAHLEAGLRSFNRAMPEEINRVLTDHASDLLLAPTINAAAHLEREGLARRTVVVGDVMVDVLLQVDSGLAGKPPPGFLVGVGDFVLATIHRAENTDDPARLRAVMEALANVETTVILPVHPRLRDAALRFDVTLETGSIRVVDPLSYSEMLQAIRASRSVITDSGGVQKEAFVLDTPVTTVRDETEWTETLEDGWNVLVGDLAQLSSLAMRKRPSAERGQPYGQGNAASKAAEAMAKLS